MRGPRIRQPQALRDLNALQEVQQGRTDAIMGDLARDIVKAVRARQKDGQPMTNADFDAVRPAINRALNRTYGPRRGVMGELGISIQKGKGDASQVVFARFMQGVTRAISRDQELLNTIERKTGVPAKR